MGLYLRLINKWEISFIYRQW